MHVCMYVLMYAYTYAWMIYNSRQVCSQYTNEMEEARSTGFLVYGGSRFSELRWIFCSAGAWCSRSPQKDVYDSVIDGEWTEMHKALD